MNGTVSVSFVVPVYSGERYLTRLVAEINTLQTQWLEDGCPLRIAEVCLVDDAAIDSSPQIIDSLAESFPFVRALHLSRNFGQHPATIAGISQTTGDWVVTLDEDLQHPPAEIRRLLLKAIAAGADLVYASAESAVHQNALRDFGSRGYKALIEAISGNENIRIFNSFRLIRGSVARAASLACGHDTYFDIALSWFTQRVTIVEMRLKDERFIQSGASGYRLKKLISHARRMLMSSGAKSLRLAGFLGICISVLTMFAAALLALAQFFAPDTIPVRGWASLIITTTFFGGMTMILIATVLEYLSLLVLQAHGKPLYFIIDRSLDRELANYFTSAERPDFIENEIPEKH